VTPEALALVLTAAVLHALWNLAAKSVVTDRLAFIWLYVVASAAVWLPVAVVWIVVADEEPAWVWLGAAAVTAVLHIGYQLALQRGYAEGDLNLVYPLARGTGPLLTFVVAVALLGERPGVLAACGVLMVVAGVLVISIAPGGSHRPVGPGVRWGLATGAAIAAYTLWDSHAVTTLEVPPVPYFVLGLVIQVPALTLMLGRGLSAVPGVWRDARLPVLAVALLSPLAYILVLEAMRTTPVSLVAAARESSIVVGALLGWLVLGEERPLHRVLGSALVAAGIAAIVLG
jgi:uncharacterized membrane protein